MPSVMRKMTSLLIALLLFAACGDGEAPADAPQLLFTQNSSGAVLTDTTLTLTGVSSQTSWFAEFPYPAAGQVPTEVFVARGGEAEFQRHTNQITAKLTCSVFGEARDYALELKTSRRDDGDVVYGVALSGDSALPAGASMNCTSEASLFIFGLCKHFPEICSKLYARERGTGLVSPMVLY